jgi:MFS family permease
MNRWTPLAVLAAAQFVMVLDQAVMNVSISQLVVDLDTDVSAIQAVITLYSLVMAMLMVTGGKVGDLLGRRRAFVIGLVIYAAGSSITALAPNVLVLAFGWSLLEGVGAALVLPALAALVAGGYEQRDRVIAYAVIGGVAGGAVGAGTGRRRRPLGSATGAVGGGRSLGRCRVTARASSARAIAATRPDFSAKSWASS